MLVLTRKPGERVLIGDGIVVAVLDVTGRSVRLGFEAPGLGIVREEVRDRMSRRNERARNPLLG